MTDAERDEIRLLCQGMEEITIEDRELTEEEIIELRRRALRILELLAVADSEDSPLEVAYAANRRLAALLQEAHHVIVDHNCEEVGKGWIEDFDRRYKAAVSASPSQE